MSQGYTPSIGDEPDRLRASCRGRVRHPSKGHALAELGRVLRYGEVSAPQSLDAYKCRHCGKWHLGNRRQVEREDQAHGQIQDRAED